jgi:hypothetical protein
MAKSFPLWELPNYIPHFLKLDLPLKFIILWKDLKSIYLGRENNNNKKEGCL